LKTLFVLSLRQMLGGRKIWVLVLFLSLPILLVLAVLAAGGFNEIVVDGDVEIDAVGLGWSAFLYLMYPQSLCILAALLYGASLLAGEIEDKTLVYLFTRALPRWKILLGKYIATAAVLSVLSIASMSASYVLCGLPVGFEVWFALAVTIGGACFTYTALFCLLGLLVPRRAIPVGLIYAVVIEGFLSVIPAVVNELTASYYLRSLAWRIADLPLPEQIADDFEREVAPFLAGAGPSSAVLALAVISLATLLLSAVVIHRRQWPLTEGV
jgi:ABC-type transport system involved in multi-copper enzyme maturation permease subunit